MGRRIWMQLVMLSAAAIMAFAPSMVRAQDQNTPDGLVRHLSENVLDTVQKDKAMRDGDIARIMVLVDERIMPSVNFARMTASAVGPSWRQASAEQRLRLQSEFKTLLVRTYSGALAQVASDQSISVKPLRAAPEDKDVLVRTEIRGRGDPIQLDYRLEKDGSQGPGWKIYNLNVMGVWLVETYRSQFAQEINAKGIDGLIASLAARNAANALKK